MSLNTNIPQPLQSLGQTWLAIQQNFNNIESGFTVNHVDWNSGANTGKHNFVTMPEQAASPGTAADEMALYTKAVAGVTQMFIQREGIAPAGADINFTGATTNTSNDTTTLPSGVILKWGIATTLGTALTINFTVPFPNHRLAFLTTSTDLTGKVVNLNFWTLAAATVVTNGNNVGFYWFAIGN